MKKLAKAKEAKQNKTVWGWLLLKEKPRKKPLEFKRPFEASNACHGNIAINYNDFTWSPRVFVRRPNVIQCVPPPGNKAI